MGFGIDGLGSDRQAPGQGCCWCILYALTVDASERRARSCGCVRYEGWGWGHVRFGVSGSPLRGIWGFWDEPESLILAQSERWRHA